MKKFLTLAVIMLATLTLSAKDYKYSTVVGDPMQTRIYTLDNGLKVYLSVNKDKPRIYTNIAVHTGSRNDPAETTGLAHYLEHIMFKGTKQYGTRDYEKEKPFLDQIRDKYEVYRTLTDDAQRKQCYHEIDSLSQLAAQYNIPNEYDKLCASLGADGTNAYTSNDQTVYVNEIPSNELEKWLKVEADRFQNLVIRGFHTELEAVYEEYNMGIAKDSRKMWPALTAKLYPNHPYGTQTTIGTQQHLKNPSIVNIENYYNNYYCPNNVAIVLAGDFDPDNTIALIDKYFGSWKKNENLTRPTYPAIKEATAPSDTTVVGQEAAFMFLAWPAEAAKSHQLDTLALVSHVLYNGKAGLLDLNVNQPMKCAFAGAFVQDLEEYSSLLFQGQPKEGQTNKDVKDIILSEIEKLKKGDFDEAMLKAIVNNLKKSEYAAIESNEDRVSTMTDAFINGKEWADEVHRLDRISKITKAELVSFANRFFKDNYVAIYKEVGTDSTLKKIEKPAITPIPANREYQSKFVSDIVNEASPEIQPVFPDFDKDIQKATTKRGLPVRYVKNTENGLFTLIYSYNFGTETEPFIDYLSDYLELVGTKKYSAEEIQKMFYAMACNYSISAGDREAYVYISGLSENMTEAMKLYEHIISNAIADYDQYKSYIDLVEKDRMDAKMNQESCFRALSSYGYYGKKSSYYRAKSIKELRETKPETILATANMLKNHKHKVLYYGPMELKDVVTALDKNHTVAKKLVEAEELKVIQREATPRNEVFIAPYEAKNIYMRMYNCEDRRLNPEELATINLFNTYYGGGMNTIVFQELRETRGLAYSAGAYYSTPSYKDEKESFVTSIITQNDKMADCVNTFKQILDTIPQQQEAFEISKQTLLKNLATERTIKTGLLTSQLASEKLGLNKSVREIVYKNAQNLTFQDIVNFANTHISNKPFRYLILGDEKELDMKALEKLGPITRLSLEDIFNY